MLIHELDKDVCVETKLRVPDPHRPRSPCSSGQDRHQTAGFRSLTQYVTVIPNVSMSRPHRDLTNKLVIIVAIAREMVPKGGKYVCRQIGKQTGRVKL
jgi:hypothetical protein